MRQFDAQVGNEMDSTNHAFDDPGWVGNLRLYEHAIVESDTEVGATTD
jgi:hypothetical protein